MTNRGKFCWTEITHTELNRTYDGGIRSTYRGTEHEDIDILRFWNSDSSIFLYVTASPPHAAGKHATDEDADDLEDRDANTNPTNDGHIIHNELFKLLEAAFLVDVIRSLGSEDLLTTLLHRGLAAGVRNTINTLPKRGVLPVVVVFHAAAYKVTLDCIPGVGDAL